MLRPTFSILLRKLAQSPETTYGESLPRTNDMQIGDSIILFINYLKCQVSRLTGVIYRRKILVTNYLRILHF